jgi:hypothetical protein
MQVKGKRDDYCECYDLIDGRENYIVRYHECFFFKRHFKDILCPELWFVAWVIANTIPFEKYPKILWAIIKDISSGGLYGCKE